MSAVGGSFAEPAPTTASADPASAPSVYDKIWRQARLYESKTNPVIQSLDFTGRFQVDYTTIFLFTKTTSLAR